LKQFAKQEVWGAYHQGTSPTPNGVRLPLDDQHDHAEGYGYGYCGELR
jgi:hypothetical protein